MSAHVSLSEVHKSVAVPGTTEKISAGRKLLAFGGPAYLVSVGYMDPGNWATDLEGGSRFGYDLLWVLVMSNLMAVLLQTLSARLGIVTGRDLAQACRDNYSKPVTIVLWVLCEIAIAACDLAEVLGTAIALNLLFGISLMVGVLITAFDALILLALQRAGMRKLEMLIISLVFVVGGSFLVEMILAKPDPVAIVGGLVPKLNMESLYVAIGILGATVMPHNLYLHSALVQTRRFDQTVSGMKEACKFNFLDSFIALNGALLINGGILILAAAVFFNRGQVVTEIQQAHQLLTPLLGNSLGSTLFAVALLASGQSSTVTGTLAGQIVMEGFIHLKIRPIIRRLLTRSLAIIPATLVIWYSGDSATYDLLIFSQVILSMQLAFAVIPLIQFTSDKHLMGEFANKLWVKVLAWLCALIIVGLNIQLLIAKETEALSATGTSRTIGLIGLPLMVIIGAFLAYIIVAPWLKKKRAAIVTSTEILDLDESPAAFSRIGIALDRSEMDRQALQHAVALARKADQRVEIVVLHVVTSAQTTMFAGQSRDTATLEGEEYLRRVATQLETMHNLDVTMKIGYGQVKRELIRLAQESDLDVLIMGAHGHRGLKDIIFGATISSVRHALSIPILVIR